MKVKTLLILAASVFSFAACNSSQNSNGAADSDTIVVDSIIPMDSVIVDTPANDTITL